MCAGTHTHTHAYTCSVHVTRGEPLPRGAQHRHSLGSHALAGSRGSLHACPRPSTSPSSVDQQCWTASRGTSDIPAAAEREAPCQPARETPCRPAREARPWVCLAESETLDSLSASEIPGMLLLRSYMHLGSLRVFFAFVIMNYMDSE